MGGKFYLQRDGGPIGLRSTAFLLSLIMKMLDKAWLELCDREGLQIHLFYRYVDNVRNCLQALLEGWRLAGHEFQFKEASKVEDAGQSDLRRTTTEIAKAMSSLINYLDFEGEDCEMFESGLLLTLDT